MQGEFEHDEVHSEGSDPQVKIVNENILVGTLTMDIMVNFSVLPMNCRRKPMGP